MNEEARREFILKMIDVFEEAVNSDFAPKESIGAALAVGMSIANELHAISVALEWANELTVEGRNRA